MGNLVVFSCCHVWLFVTPRTTTCQAPCPSLSPSLLRFLSIELVMLTNHLILWHSHYLLPSIFLSIRVSPSELAQCINWPKYWSLSISPSNEYLGLISFRIDWFHSLQSKGLSRVFSSTTFWEHQFFSPEPSLWSNSHIRTWLLEKP